MSSDSSQSRNARLPLIAVVLVVVFAIATVLLTRPQTGGLNLSSVSGLMSLKALAAESMPYEVALANQQPTLIEFYADWCTTCQSMAPMMEALHDEFGEQVNFVMLNIDDPQWRQPIREFHATGVPQLTLLQADQSLVDTWVGRVPKSLMEQRLQGLTG